MKKAKLNLAALEALRLPALQQKYEEIVGERTRCPNRAWLVRKMLEAGSVRLNSKRTRLPEQSSNPTMSVEALQARHLELIGRPTSSSHVGYLRWRLRQAERGLIRAGSKPRVPHGAEDMLVLPLRMPAAVVARMDEARRRLGLASRADLLRRALHRYFVESDEPEIAALLLRGEGITGAGAAPVSEARS